MSGIQKNYNYTVTGDNLDADTIAALEAKVTEDINVEYFPSWEDDKVVAKAATLSKGTEYDVVFDSYDNETKTARLNVEAQGEYKGTHQIEVKINSAVVTKDPVPKKGLIYKGVPHLRMERDSK